jgi:hypothetical protein
VLCTGGCSERRQVLYRWLTMKSDKMKEVKMRGAIIIYNELVVGPITRASCVVALL